MIVAECVLATAALAAERLTGRARTIDGDTLAVAGVHVRLKGVAAPEAARRLPLPGYCEPR